MSEPQLHVTRWGNSGARAVLIHGGVQGGSLGGDTSFAAQERLAARGFEVVVPDRPGHGKSAAPGRGDDAEADAVWAADLLGDGAHLVGHSFGGCVALATATRRPDAVRSLTLIEPAMQRLAVSDPRVRGFVLRMIAVQLFSFSPTARIQRFARLVGIPPEHVAKRTAEEQARMGVWMRRIVLPTREVLERQLVALRERRTPLLVVTGGWSPAIDATADAVAALGGGERAVIRCEHHFPHLVSDEFNTRFAEFAHR